MPADQRKRRVNASSLVACASGDKYSAKKKRLEVAQQSLKTRNNISLEWDSKKKSVVSKREQIGISRRHLLPFIESSPHGNSILADVISVPQEMYELKNLSEVLSYEVWQNHLSEKERIFLSQFLPKEADVDRTVRNLLAGNNFNFGNPSLNWGTSVCIREHHPDNVIHEEKALQACKKSYHSSLQEYHTNMIKNLQTWKEKWYNCREPEVDILQNIWRSRNRAEKSSLASDTRFVETEELIATPESCSWSEKAYSSDNQNLEMVHGESQRRKVAGKGNHLGNKNHKPNVFHGDGAKYMSYIKVSKEQHEQVKSSMKHSSNSILPKSLNKVLGSIDALNVQPYERFEEEERKKLHNYWLRLANKDIPEALATWTKRQSQRQQETSAVCEEIEQKVERIEAEEKHGSQDNAVELSDDDDEVLPSDTVEGVDKEQSYDMLEQMNDEGTIHEITKDVENESERNNDYTFEEQTNDDEMIEDEEEEQEEEEEDDDDVAKDIFIPDRTSPRVSAMINPSNHVLFDQHQNSSSINNPIQIQPDGNSSSRKTTEYPLIVSDPFPGNLSHADIISVSQSSLFPSQESGDVHRSSYYQSSPAIANNGYVSTQFIPEEPLQLLETQSKDSVRNDMSFNSFGNQNQHDLLQGQSSMSYHNLQKQLGPGPQYQTINVNDLMMEGQFPRQHSSHLDFIRQKRLNDLYLHHNNIQQTSMYSASMPRQHDHHMPVSHIHHNHDWSTVNGARMPGQHLNGGDLSQNWYNNIGQTGLPSFESVNHSSSSFSSGGRNSDQSLYSVLSECNQLQPGPTYNSMGSAGQRFLHQNGNYGVLPSSSNLLVQPSTNPLSYLSGHDPTVTAGLGNKIINSNSNSNSNNNLGWMMGLQPPNSGGLQESSLSKSFLRSWNQ